ncbi:CARDB domain-containing protein [Candidatus Aenigmatarchaeota archaeon]
MKHKKLFIISVVFAFFISLSAISVNAADYRYQPDLVVTDIWFNQITSCRSIGLSRTAEVQVTINVRNQGNVTAYNFTDTIEIYGAGPYKSQDFFVSYLPGGNSVNHTKVFKRNCFQTMYANATADYYDDVSESDEYNNRRMENYYVG